MSTFLHYVHCKDALLDCSAPGGESPNLANSIPHTTVSPLNSMNERNAFSFYINPTTETEIISLIKLLKMEAQVMIQSQRPQLRIQRLRLLHHLRISWTYLYRLVYSQRNWKLPGSFLYLNQAMPCYSVITDPSWYYHSFQRYWSG